MDRGRASQLEGSDAQSETAAEALAARVNDTVQAFATRLGSPMDAAALDAHCLARIARFKRPKDYRFVTELPKNNYGKILKTKLRSILENGEGHD